jgi:hypothetical protein
MADAEVAEHLHAFSVCELSLSEYAKQNQLDRRTFAEGMKRYAPERYAAMVASGRVGEGADKGRTGTKLETSAKGMLERKKGGCWIVFKAHGSHGVADLIALRAGCPTLLVQAKKDGKIGPDEWNELVDVAERAGAWAVLVRRPEGATTGAQWFRLTGARPKGSRLADFLEPFDPAFPEQPTLLAAAAAG